MVKYSEKYVPTKNLSKKNTKKAIKELNKSIKLYKNGIYYVRKPIKGFKSKKSSHISKVKELYAIDKVKPSKKLSKATGCKIEGLKKIVAKGQGAYFSSGSRPSQTPHSWGYARLASAITGGKSSVVDYHILEKYCNENSMPIKLAKKLKKKNSSTK